MNSEIKNAIELAFINLNSLNDKDFQSELNKSIDSELALSILRSGFFESGELEVESFCLMDYEKELSFFDFNIQHPFTSITSLEFDSHSLKSNILAYSFVVEKNEFSCAA